MIKEYFTKKGYDCTEQEGAVLIKLANKNGLEITTELEVSLQSNDGFYIRLGKFADCEQVWQLLNLLGKAK